MARSRSIPTKLFEDPDFFERSPQTQLIFIGLILDADDYGRGLAHSGLLARKLNQEVAHIDIALNELQEAELLHCYPGDRHRYYSLTRWQEWQTLHKPTPSRFPAPPPVAPRSSGTTFPEFSWEISEHPGKGTPEGEGEEEYEENQKREEERGSHQHDTTTSTHVSKICSQTKEPDPPQTLQVPSPSKDQEPVSPSPHPVPAGVGQPQPEISETSHAVAAILGLPSSDALTRVVQDYRAHPAISLLGEADAARAYLDDPRRNHKGQSMSVPFFRRWLKREEGYMTERQSQAHQAVVTPPSHASGGWRSGEDGATDPETKARIERYRVFIAQREQETKERLLRRRSQEVRDGALALA